MRSRPLLIPLLLVSAACALALVFFLLRSRGSGDGFAAGAHAGAMESERIGQGALDSSDNALPLADSATPVPRTAAEGTPATPDAPPAPDAEARIDGVVVRPDGRPAALARVQYAQWRPDRGPDDQREDSTVTDEQGLFTINPAPVGHLRLVALHDEFAASETSVFDLAAGERKRDLRLELREYGRIRGLVLDAHNVARTRIPVTCENMQTRKALFAESDASGRFEFSKVVAGYQLVSLKPPQEELDDIRADAPFLANLLARGDQERFLEVPAGQTVELVLGGIPVGGVRVFGRVSSGAAPAPRTWIWAVNPDVGRFAAPRTRTDERGEYELWLPEAGEYEFHLVGAGGGFDLVRTQPVREEHEQRVDFDVPGGSISGRVADGAGRPIGEANVALISDAPADRRPSASFELWMPHCATDVEGRFAFVHLPAGRYALVATPVSKPDEGSGLGRTRSGAIELAAGATVAGLEIVLTPGCTIRGTVRGAPEGSARQPRVLAYDEAGHAVASVRVDTDWTFVLRGLSEGSYGLRASGYTFESPVSVPVRVRAGREEQVELTLGAAAMISIGAKWPPGVAPLALQLVLRDQRGNRIYEPSFDPQFPALARFGLAAGTYTAEFSAAGGWSATETLVAEAGKESSLELLLRHEK
jgi:hypothetical protein